MWIVGLCGLVCDDGAWCLGDGMGGNGDIPKKRGAQSFSPSVFCPPSILRPLSSVPLYVK